MIDTARIPIIKMLDLETHVQLDLSFNHIVAQNHTTYFSTMVKCNKLFREVAVILKYWLKVRGMNSPFNGGISSTALYFMGLWIASKPRSIEEAGLLTFSHTLLRNTETVIVCRCFK